MYKSFSLGSSGHLCPHALTACIICLLYTSPCDDTGRDILAGAGGAHVRADSSVGSICCPSDVYKRQVIPTDSDRGYFRFFLIMIKISVRIGSHDGIMPEMCIRDSLLQ